MRKFVLVLALLAMLAVAALPAIAQVSQDSDQDADSEELDQSSNVTQTGDNSNQCVGGQQVGNTGNAQTQTSVLQYGSAADEFEFEDVGSSIDVSPSNSTSCEQSVNQLAIADSK